MASKSVSMRYKAYLKARAPEEATKPVEEMTLAELEKETIAFGEAMKGKSFPAAMADNGWTDFILSRYGNSEKPAHKKFVRYVNLKLDLEGFDEKEVKSASKKKSSKPSTIPVSPTMAEAVEWDSDEEFSKVLQNQEMEEEMGLLRQEQVNVGRRLNQMEHMMQEMLNHLQKLEVKSEK